MSAQSNSVTTYEFVDDPYKRYLQDESNNKNLIANDRASKFARKYQRFKQTLQTKKTYFLYGGMQGFGIGLLAGFGIGVISAFQARRFILIPMSMIGSGIFFSGVMSFGSLIRSVDHQFMKQSKLFSEKVKGKPLYLYVQEKNEILKQQKVL